MAQKTIKPRVGKKPVDTGLPFSKRNYLVFGLGLLFIVVGFIALGLGSITLAPILLVVGYLVIIPVAIMLKPHNVQPPAGSEPPKKV